MPTPPAKTIILIVDDVVSFRALFKSWLLAKPEAQERLEIIECGDGEEAVALCTLHHPQLVLLDVVMSEGSGVDGFQVCRRVKKNPETANVPIVIVTSKDGKADQFWGKKQGADGYMLKPVVREQLVNEINRIFAEKNLPPLPL